MILTQIAKIENFFKDCYQQFKFLTNQNDIKCARVQIKFNKLKTLV